MMVNHRNQGKSPSIKVDECIQKFYEYLHKADPMKTINPLHDEEGEEGHKFVPITEPSLFPSNMLSPHNHMQICNSFIIVIPTNRYVPIGGKRSLKNNPHQMHKTP